ncbi:hypothetical protein MUP00_00475, partial [Candidatus Bathyarchaeota archaeon]|nr:hypothetical protein [Candidatus Bathyarchaeota archaeon]
MILLILSSEKSSSVENPLDAVILAGFQQRADWLQGQADQGYTHFSSDKRQFIPACKAYLADRCTDRC